MYGRPEGASSACLTHLGSLLGRTRELHDVLQVGGRVPPLSLDCRVDGHGAGFELSLQPAVVIGAVAALDSEPRVLDLVGVVRRAVGRVDTVLVVITSRTVLDGADRDRRLVQALLGTKVPEELPDDEEGDSQQDEERLGVNPLRTIITHGNIAFHSTVTNRVS